MLIGPGNGPTGPPVDVLFERKIFVNVCAVMEPRRGLEDSFGGVVPPLLLLPFEDISAFGLKV